VPAAGAITCPYRSDSPLPGYSGRAYALFSVAVSADWKWLIRLLAQTGLKRLTVFARLKFRPAGAVGGYGLSRMAQICAETRITPRE